MAFAFAISRSRVFGRLRYLNQFSNQQSTFTSTRKKQSNAAFLFGFGLAGLMGFSGILYKKQRKRIAATSVERDGLSEEHCSSQSVSNIEEANRNCCSSWTLQSAIEESRSIIWCMKEETGCPGVCVAVSIDGKTVWSEGFGFADIENRVLCSSKTVMRIASISKPLTAAAAAKLWEEGKLDLDIPIQKYVASFPEKTFSGTPVILTTRHLLCHLGGIRDYNKNKPSNEENNSENQSKNSNTPKERVMASSDTRKSGTIRNSCTCTQQSDSHEEFYIKDHYNTVTEALSIFKDDPLLSVPGTSYFYTTHGWTLLTAVIEGASNQDFLPYMKKLFKELGMENTCAEFNDRIIYNRARFYQRNNKGHLINAPYVDNSHKWGGGGFMSNVEDLLQFGNSMLYAKQIGCLNKENFGTTGYLPGFLRPETVTELWKIVANTQGKGHKSGGYGLGWVVIPEKQDFGCCYHQSESVLHSGGAAGASSILLIRPHHIHTKPPKGVAVVILVNLQRVNLEKTAMDVAACFEKTRL